MQYKRFIAPLLAILLSFGAVAQAAFPPTTTGQGGTGSTSPSGILYGTNSNITALQSVVIGSNLTFSGGTLSATGGSGGAFPFTPFSGYNGTTTVLAFPGFISSASSSLPYLGTGGVAVNNGLLYNAATTTFSSPLLYSGGNVTCQTATGSVPGCLSAADWTTFNGKGSGTVTAVTGTWPIISSGGNTPAISFGGLSTSTAAVQGNIPYFSGVNTFANVATTSATCSGTVSCTGFTVIGSSPITITGSGGSGGGSIGFASTTANIESIQFYGKGYVGIGTTTPAFLLHLATSTAPQLALSDGSLTSNPWVFRSINNNLYLASSSPSTFATSSQSALRIDTNGNFMIGTSTMASSTAPARLTVQGGITAPSGNGQGQEAFGAGASIDPAGLGYSTVLGYRASVTTSFGTAGQGSVVIGASANSSSVSNVVIGQASSASQGTSIVIGTNLTSASAGSVLIGSGGDITNSASAAIGFANHANHADAVVLGWGNASLSAAEFSYAARSVPTTTPSFRLGGSTSNFLGRDMFQIATSWPGMTADGNRKAQVDFNSYDFGGTRNFMRANTTGSSVNVEFLGGNVGVGTSTPQFLLQLASSTAPQLNLTDGSLASAQWNFRNAGGNLYFASSSPSTFATSSNAAPFVIMNSGNIGIASSTPAFSFSVNNAGSDFYIDTSGKIVGRDTTNGWSGRISPTHSFVLSTATTTGWTASTTGSVYSPYLSMPFAGTLRQVRCISDVAGLGVNVQINGSNVTPSYFVGSTTAGIVGFTSGNTFTLGQKILANFGTTTTSTTGSMSCTFDVTETP